MRFDYILVSDHCLSFYFVFARQRLWTCIRHENVMRGLVIYAFFLKVLTVAL